MWYAQIVIKRFILNTANIISGKPYTSRGVCTVWEGVDELPSTRRWLRSLPHDHFLYLGGNEQSTHKYISELLGKATIDTKTRGITKGRSGSSSANYQNTGRELLMPDEVRMLDNDYALLFIRGERAVSDKKYDLMKHPNIKLTEDGVAESYYRPLKNLDKQPIYDFSAEDLQIEFDMTGIEILE